MERIKGHLIVIASIVTILSILIPVFYTQLYNFAFLKRRIYLNLMADGKQIKLINNRLAAFINRTLFNIPRNVNMVLVDNKLNLRFILVQDNKKIPGKITIVQIFFPEPIKEGDVVLITDRGWAWRKDSYGNSYSLPIPASAILSKGLWNLPHIDIFLKDKTVLPFEYSIWVDGIGGIKREFNIIPYATLQRKTPELGLLSVSPDSAAPTCIQTYPEQEVQSK